MAEQAFKLSDRRDPFLLDTLAAAYAEVGRFGDARQTAQEAIDIALLTGHYDLVKDIKRRLELYKSNHPYRKDHSLAEN
jgi:hypothetical protein